METTLIEKIEAVEKTKHVIPAETKIIPKGELVGESGYAKAYLDNEEGVIYRVTKKDELERIAQKTGDERIVEYAEKDFWHKIEVGQRDTTGLTPEVYEYDPESGIIKMEYIEGTTLDKLAGELPAGVRQEFLSRLVRYHQLGLYHGDLYPLEHYILTPKNAIRVIDPSYMYEIPGKTIEYFQEIDIALAEKRLRELEKKPKVELFAIQEQRSGDFITQMTPELAKAIEEDEITTVYQKGIGFIDGNDSRTRYIETSGFTGEHPSFGSCVAVIAWGEESKICGVFHADTLTDIFLATKLLNERFQTDETVELSIIGGQTDVSEGILQSIKDNLGPTMESRKWELKRIDILGRKNAKTRQVIVDALTGVVFNLQGENSRRVHSWIEMPEEIKQRERRTALIKREVIVDSDMEDV